MLLKGPNMKDQLDRNKIRRKAGLTIAQLLVINSVKHVNASVKNRVRHNKSQETPPPIYVD